MNRRYFGTDGVRGKVGKLPITPDFVMKLGQAAGRVLKRHSPTGHATVLIGKDTRVSGYMLEAALQAGFSAAGTDVVLCGPIPTPAVAYLTRATTRTTTTASNSFRAPVRSFPTSGSLRSRRRSTKASPALNRRTSAKPGALTMRRAATSNSASRRSARRSISRACGSTSTAPTVRRTMLRLMFFMNLAQTSSLKGLPRTASISIVVLAQYILKTYPLGVRKPLVRLP